MAAVKSETNVTVSYNSNALDAYLNEASLEAISNALDSTNFDSTSKESVLETTEWSISVGGYWHATLDGYFQADAITPVQSRTIAITFTDADSGTATYTWSTGGIENYTISSSVGSLITWSGTLRLSGTVTPS